MTRILVQRGSTGSSSSQNRSLVPGSSSAPTQPQITPAVKEEQEKDVLRDQSALGQDEKKIESNEALLESVQAVRVGFVPEGVVDKGRTGCNDVVDSAEVKDLNELQITEGLGTDGNEESRIGSSRISAGSSCPPPPPPPVRYPKPSTVNLRSRRSVSGCSHALRAGSNRRAVTWPVVLTGTTTSNSQPPSPRSYDEGEGYNSGDEHTPHFGFCYDDVGRERQFELDIRRVKGLEVKCMVEDGNCLFRAVADQVYGDTEAYDLTRQMCVDYMEREQDHFSQFITEGFTSYCKRKRRDKVYGNNIEIQALSEMYNRPIHIYSYSTEPINIFHGSYDTDTPPIRLSYHCGNHYNTLIDPRRLTIGAGLGFSNLQGGNIDKDQVKAAIRAQQDQQIDNALLAEGRFYSDLELTEKEIERMVIEVSRSEYLGEDKWKTQLGFIGSSASSSEPSSSGSTVEHTQSDSKVGDGKERSQPNRVLSNSMQMMLSMGFSYLQAIEAYSIFGDDVDSMICYLLETGSSSAASGSINRLKGKAME